MIRKPDKITNPNYTKNISYRFVATCRLQHTLISYKYVINQTEDNDRIITAVWFSFFTKRTKGKIWTFAIFRFFKPENIGF